MGILDIVGVLVMVVIMGGVLFIEYYYRVEE